MTPETIERYKQQIAHEFARSERGEHPSDFPALPPLPAARYFDRAFFDAEQRRVWPKAWLLAGHVDELPEPGSYKLWDRVGWPVMLVRGKDGEIRAFFNSCRHRGAALLRGESSGKTRKLVCKFHAWTYELDGQLLFVPEEHDFPGLDKTQSGLVPLRCERWGKLLFVNRDPDAPPLMQHLGKLASELAHFDWDARRVNTIVPYELPCNWKVIMDAFQESYHLDATHTHTVAPMLEGCGSVIDLWPNGHSLLTVPMRRSLPADAPFLLAAGMQSQDPRHEITRTTNPSFTIYPNIIGTMSEFQMPILVFWPDGPNRTHVDIVITEPESCAGMAPELAQTVIEQFKIVMGEDMGNVAAIQRSVESRAIDSIRLGYQERRIYQFHEQIDRDLGKELPAGLGIPPLIEPFIQA